jgi:hypothetical protein
MTTKRFALEEGGPERLEVTFGPLRWSPGQVRLDGQEIAKVSTNDLYSNGIYVRLPDGAELRMRIGIGGFHITLNDKPLPGSSQPMPSQTIIGSALMFGIGFSIIGILLALFGIFTIIGQGPPPFEADRNLSGGAIISLAIIVGAVGIIIARGIWKKRKWARYMTIAFFVMLVPVFIYAGFNGRPEVLCALVGIGAAIWWFVTNGTGFQ